MTPNDETIHVVLCVYDPSGNYSQHAGVVMTSIFENTKSKILVHILHDDTLTQDNRKKFIRTAEKYSQSIKFIDVTKYKDSANHDEIKRALKNYSVGILFRLCVPEVLNLEKIIYLDCDIVVNLDIKELWEINIGENYIAGVKDSFLGGLGERTRQKLIGCGKDYINSGVLIMNLEKIRKHGNLFNDSVEWFPVHAHLLTTGDQDFLNAYFSGDIKIIDGKFNRFGPDTEKECADAIIHTPGIFSKTWDMNGAPVQKLYWENYLRSAWGEDKTPAEIVDILSNAAIKSSLKHSKNYHASAGPCIKNTIRSIPRKIFLTNPPVLAMRYIFRDMLHKFTRK